MSARAASFELADVTFTLYGLDGSFRGQRRIGAVGRGAGRISSVTLLHGTQAAQDSIAVTAMGPLGGSRRPDTPTVDPMPMIATELLSAARVSLRTPAELADRVAELLATPFLQDAVQVDGTMLRAQVLQVAQSSAALIALATGCLLYVISRTTPISGLSLVALADLTAYIA